MQDAKLIGIVSFGLLWRVPHHSPAQTAPPSQGPVSHTVSRLVTKVGLSRSQIYRRFEQFLFWGEHCRHA